MSDKKKLTIIDAGSLLNKIMICSKEDAEQNLLLSISKGTIQISKMFIVLQFRPAQIQSRLTILVTSIANVIYSLGKT